MTSDELEHKKNKGFIVFGDFGLQNTCQERIAPKSLEIDQDKQHM